MRCLSRLQFLLLDEEAKSLFYADDIWFTVSYCKRTTATAEHSIKVLPGTGAMKKTNIIIFQKCLRYQKRKKQITINSYRMFGLKHTRHWILLCNSSLHTISTPFLAWNLSTIRGLWGPGQNLQLKSLEVDNFEFWSVFRTLSCCRSHLIFILSFFFRQCDVWSQNSLVFK